VYGNGDCSEFDFCGAREGRGGCLKGRCVCASGYGGKSCELEAQCHFWDEAQARWSAEGMRTLPPEGTALAEGAARGSGGYIRCIASVLPDSTTQFAALWAPALPPLTPPSPPPVNGTLPVDALTLLPMEANPVFLSIMVILLLDIASLASAAYLRRNKLKGLFGNPPLAKEDMTPAGAASLAAVRTAARLGLVGSGKSGSLPPLLALLGPKAKPDPDKAAEGEGGGGEAKPAGSTSGDGSSADRPPSEPAPQPMIELSARFEIEVDKPEDFDDNAFLRRLSTLVGVEYGLLGGLVSGSARKGCLVFDAEIRCPDAMTLVMAAKTLKKNPAPLGLALGAKLAEPPIVHVPEPPPTPQEGARRGPPPAAIAGPAPPDGALAAGGAGGAAPAAERPKAAQGDEGVAAEMVPTIQERIKPMGGSRAGSRILERRGARGAADGRGGFLGVAPSGGARPSSLGGFSPNNATTAALGGGLDSGIQERIPISGIGGRRGASSLRLTSAQNPAGLIAGQIAGCASAVAGGAATAAGALADGGGRVLGGVLGGLRLTEEQLMGSAGADPAPRELVPTPQAPPTVLDGIQERLPAMPGLRGRSRRTLNLGATDSVGQALRTAPPVGGEPAGGFDGAFPTRQPIQERVPRMGGAPPGGISAPVPPNAPVPRASSPPPSPPAGVLPAGSGGAGLLPHSPVASPAKKPGLGGGLGGGLGSLISAPPKVLPAARGGGGMQDTTSTALVVAGGAAGGAARPPPPAGKAWRRGTMEDLSWDDRSVKEIVVGSAREHTLLGFVSAFLYGDGPKLPSIAQSAQLLWGSVLALLFLSVLQLRYSWLGATWSGTPLQPLASGTSAAASIDYYARLPTISTVAVASAVLCWPCVLIARGLFYVANRTDRVVPPESARYIFGAAWSIVLVACMAMGIGAINMAGNLDATAVNFDVMVGWALAAGVQWLLIEPTALVLFAAFHLLLKWCTSFEENLAPLEPEEKTPAELMRDAIKDERERTNQEVSRAPLVTTPLKALTNKPTKPTSESPGSEKAMTPGMNA
jgi:hypothetical protein